MKKHQKIIASVAAIAGASLITISFFQKEETPSPPENETKNPGEVSFVEENDVVSGEKISTSIIGNHSFKENDFTDFVSLSWDSKEEIKDRFILVDNKEEITEEKREKLQKWITEKKVVIFYGEDVKPEKVQEKLGMEIGIINVESTATFDFPYLLYGYGFSTTYQQNIPIFLGSNTNKNMNEKIASFLFKNKDF